MEEKGGETTDNDNKDISKNYVDKKIIITVILGIVIGGLVIAGMVFAGIRIAENLNKEQPTPERPAPDTPDEPVLERIKIEYDKVISNYAVIADPEAEYQNSLMHRYGVDDAEYTIIRSASELEEFVDTVNGTLDVANGATPFAYSVSDKFFETGSIVAIAKEDAGLGRVSISDIYRDANYNLQVYAAYQSPYDTTNLFGKFALIEVQNIQPKTVELIWNDYQGGKIDPRVEPEEKKPIIYIYPTKTTKVNVKLSHPERILVDYPDYRNGWTVTARPDGTLTTTEGKKLYALYYESKNIKDYSSAKLDEGFVVSKDNIENFLDQKLTILGLNFKEREEFITYWANELEKSPYAYIRFQTTDEIERNMGLKVTPQPDTTIRIIMEYKNLQQKIKVKEQKLQQVERKGFTVVEWGGTEIKR